MKLAIKFSFIDTIVMGNILEWDSRLKRAPICKLFKFSTPSQILDVIIKEKAYLDLKEGFYNLSISKEHRMGFDLKVLGNGSYCICVYEPRLGHPGAIDYSLKYHFAFIGEKEVFEKYIVCSEKPYTVVFNNFTNRDLFKEGVTLDYLANEKQGTSVVNYIKELITTRSTTAETKLSKDEPEPLELTSQTMEESKEEEDDVKLHSVHCTVVESEEENHIFHDQTLHRCPIRNPEVLERFMDLITQPRIRLEDWMGGAVEHFKNVSEIPAIPSIIGYRLKRYDDEVMFELDFDKKRSHADIIADLKLLFKTFFSKYTGVINVGGTHRQAFYFSLYDENKQPLRIIPCLVRLRLWLEHDKSSSRDPKPVTPVSTWEQKYGEQDVKPQESFMEDKSKETPIKETETSVPKVEPSTEIVKLIKELVDRFNDTFGFIPDAYTLSQLLVKGVEEEKRDLEAFDNMTYRDLYCLSKVMGMDDQPAQEFNEFIGQLIRYMEANGV